MDNLEFVTGLMESIFVIWFILANIYTTFYMVRSYTMYRSLLHSVDVSDVGDLADILYFYFFSAVIGALKSAHIIFMTVGLVMIVELATIYFTSV